MSNNNQASDESVGLSFEVAFERKEGRRQAVKANKQPKPVAKTIPYETRMLALAYYLDELLRTGQVKNYAELAKLGGVSRARISQIMDLMLIPSTLQTRLLYDLRMTTSPFTKLHMNPA